MKLTSKQDCDTCRHAPNRWTDEPCASCSGNHRNYERRTESGDMDCVSRRVEDEQLGKDIDVRSKGRATDGKERVMIVAIWIIAITEVIRVIEQSIQLLLIAKDTGNRDNAYAEFVKSLKMSDREYVKKMLEEFERIEESTDD